MSNILIIKHGSLGDIAQISGAIQDIKENHSSDKVIILTTSLYEELFHKCPYIDEVYMYQTEEELYHLIEFWKPDIRILGEISRKWNLSCSIFIANDSNSTFNKRTN